MFKIVDGKQIKLSAEEIAETESMRQIIIKGVTNAITVPKISFEKVLDDKGLLDDLDEFLDTHPDRMLKRWYNGITDIQLNGTSTQQILNGMGLNEAQAIEIFTEAQSIQF